LQVKHHLHTNATLQIHKGNSSIWSSPWTANWETIHDHLLFPVTNSPLPATVADLWMQGTTTWNNQLLSTTFDPPQVQAITSLPVIQSQQEDILRWSPAANGNCSSKAAYSYLANLQTHTLLSQGTRNISPQANSILQKVWKAKTIPPFLKTFVWRLIRRALATAERAGRFSTHIDQHCTYCGAIKNDVHLFFLCDLPAQVWTSTAFSLPIYSLDPHEDGVQIALSLLIPPNSSKSYISKFLFTSWYIWKAHNDNRFHRKIWTSFQVQKTAQAHQQNHLSALQEISQPHQHHSQPLNSDPSPSTNLFCRDTTVLRIPQPMVVPPSAITSYVDASTNPDNGQPSPRRVGLGIFIVNLQVQRPTTSISELLCRRLIVSSLLRLRQLL
jgi:hypothetical protein